LAAVKYGLDAAIVYAQTGVVWSPLRYLSPVFTLREEGLRFSSSATLALLAALALPFLWVGVSMSVRRAADAGLSPWAGLGFLVPLLNYPFMLAFCLLPPKPGVAQRWPAAGAYRSHVGPPSAGPPSTVDRTLRSALLGVAAGVVIAGAMGAVSIYVLGKYGAALFFATPFLMGAIGSYLYNRPRPRALPQSIAVGLASVVIAGAGMMLFALEGLLCLAMAFPIAAGLGLLGSIAGWAIAQSALARASHAGAAALMLPALAGAETFAPASRPIEVATAIEIDAPPERVWPHVIGFSELPPPSELAFRLGIAHPVRARIEGEGVGAVRRCEFSTGPFVEPITRWEPPHRLSFDVTSQPPPMHEWSPYRH
ncbi:MAG TPA: SRPBCC family protein, partial [Polyangiaceae bacterium]|nr:SRPBCC family protein [Polyangiaceae bacterium]